MNILLITPNFFDYPAQICEELERLGHKVDWYDDRPSSNSFVKAIIKVNKSLINGIIKRYFSSIMHEISCKHYDLVLLISGQSLSFTEDMMDQLRRSQKQAEFVLYQWDSMRNFPYIARIQKYFDRCYSFDPQDVKENLNLRFLPLFYTKKYADIGTKKVSEYKYDCIFVGTAHPKKYRFIKEMSQKLFDIYKKQFIYFYFPSRLVYIYRRLLNPEFKNARYSEFHFDPVKAEKMDELLTQAKCVLDSAQQGQMGLTIRVLETLGAKRKLITVNSDVRNYDFYCAENIYVYEGKFDKEDPFFNCPFKEIEKKIYEKYSLNNWLKEIIGDVRHEDSTN